jgi:EAL domain-containing protein (putative c-di-GMP-specific phosphodiesterase class I)
MPGRPAGGDAVRDRRLSTEALEHYASARLGRPRRPPPAWIVVGLERGDRARALTGRSDASAVTESLLARLESTLREADRYALASVDEVWVVIDEAPAEPMLRLATHALRAALDGHYPGRLDDGTPCTVRVETRIGGAWAVRPETTALDLLLAACRALSDAATVDDRMALLPAGDEVHALPRLEAAIRSTLAANGFALWYQPQVRMPSRRCETVEALVRWPRPPGDVMVSPATLVAVCEQTGLIAALTRFTVNAALRTMAGWQAQGLEPRVAINLSARVLDDPLFPDVVAQSCELFGQSPSRLTFELTESSIVRNEGAAVALMGRLSGLGCELSIDDFGTGYSSFASLRRFPIDELKIDRSFVVELASRPEDRRIVAALIELAHGFGMSTVAEGVEDEASVRILESLGIDAIQGWYFARAMPATQAGEWMRRFAGAAPAGR